jgi:exodeoxyribonuclease V alpha subunit
MIGRRLVAIGLLLESSLGCYGRGWAISDSVGSPNLVAAIRQAVASRIITNAHRINHGLTPELAPADGGDFYLVNAGDPEEGVRKLLAIVQERIPKRFGLDPIRDIQVLCPMNRGA